MRNQGDRGLIPTEPALSRDGQPGATVTAEESRRQFSPLRVAGGVGAVFVALVVVFVIAVVLFILNFVFGVFGDIWDVLNIFTRWWRS